MTANEGRLKLTHSKTALLFLISGGFIFYSYLSTQMGLKNLLTIDIPLTGDFGLGFPIPLLYWLGVFIFIYIMSRLLKAAFVEFLRSGIVIGIFIHFIFLLLNLNARNSNGDILWYSSMYELYFRVILTFVLGGFSVLSGSLFMGHASAREKKFFIIMYYVVPLFFGYVTVVIFNHHSYYLLLFMIILFTVSYYLSSGYKVYSVIKEKTTWLWGIFCMETIFLPLLFLVSMVFRIFFLTRIMSNADYWNTASDGAFLDNYARHILAGEYLPGPQSLGYCLFLAGVYSIFGRDYFTVGVIQSLFGSLAVLMVYEITKRTFGIMAGRLAAIIAAIDYPLIFSAVGIGHQAMDVFYGVLIVYILMKSMDMDSNMKSGFSLALAGLFCAVATANREANMLLPLIITGWIIYISKTKTFRRHKSIIFIVLFLGFFLLGIAPFLIFNYLNSGSFYDQSSTYGIKFVLQHYNPQLTAIGFNPILDPTGSISLILQKPLTFLKAFLDNYYTKFKVLYFSQGYGGFDPIFLVRKPMTDYYLSMWFYAYLMTFIGLVSTIIGRLKKEQPLVILILLIIAYKTIFHLFTIATYRYRAAIEPFLIMLASYGFYIVLNFADANPKVLESNDR